MTALHTNIIPITMLLFMLLFELHNILRGSWKVPMVPF